MMAWVDYEMYQSRDDEILKGFEVLKRQLAVKSYAELLKLVPLRR